MLDNIWRGLLINYHFLVNHGVQFMFVLFTIFVMALFNFLFRQRQQQRQTHFQLLEQQQYVENLQYRLSRLTRICQESKDKQRFISTQLSKIDDSIYEVEEQITSLKNGLRQQPFVEYSDVAALEQQNEKI